MLNDTIHHLALPETLALSVRRAQQFTTEIVTAASGFEIRNARRAMARRHYVLESGPIALSEGQKLSAFFDARHGRQYGFLLRDWMDAHTGLDAPMPDDETLLPLSGADNCFALIKTYRAQSGDVQRRIFKPRRDGFQLSANGRVLKMDIDYRLDEVRGCVTLSDNSDNADSLSAGFYFDTPVRFDSDRLEIERLEGDMVRVRSVPIIELMLADA